MSVLRRAIKRKIIKSQNLQIYSASFSYATINKNKKNNFISTNKQKNKEKKVKIVNNRVVYAIVVVLFLTVLALLLSSLIPSLKTGAFGNVALISISGEIVSESPEGLFAPSAVVSKDVVELVEEANNDPRIKGILFEINSGGGSAYATEEIVNAMKKVNKTKVALIREAGASGAYWIASACDKIVASRLSIVGSIGVTSSYLEFSKLMEKYGIGYERIVSGTYKDIGTPFRNLSKEEEKLMLDRIQLVYNYFFGEVVKNRNLTEEQKKEVSSGIFYTGEQALGLSLIDEIGGREETVKILEKEIKQPVVLVEYTKKESFFERMLSALSKNMFYLGSGIGSSFADTQIKALEKSQEPSIST